MDRPISKRISRELDTSYKVLTSSRPFHPSVNLKVRREVDAILRIVGGEILVSCDKLDGDWKIW